MNIENLRIIADERERKSGIPDLLKKVGVRTEVMTLKTGDYIVAEETVIERKSVSDFVASVFDGRLFDQCSRLCKEFKHPILILEGASDEFIDVIDNPFVFYAAIARVCIEYGISLIHTPDASHTAKLLISLGTRNPAGQGTLLKKPKKKSGAALHEQQLYTLCSLPGIGEKLAAKMLDRFGTPMAAFEATAADLARINGLGSARAKKLRTILGTTAKTSRRSGTQKKLRVT